MAIKKIDRVPIPPRTGRLGGIGDKAENALLRFITKTFNSLRVGVSDMIRHSLDSFLESLEQPLMGIGGPVVDDLLDIPGLPSSVRNVLTQTRSGEHQVGAILLVIAAVQVILMLVPAFLSGVFEKVKQISFFLTRPFLLDFSTWRMAELRDPSLRGTMTNDLQGQGWRDGQIRAARLASWQRLGVTEVLMAKHRGELSQSQAETRLSQLGIELADIGIWLKLSENIPGPGDLVRFALREVWDDAAVARGGYDQGMPGEFTSWMEKQGYSSEWSWAYWRAHWAVPSIGQGFEMMHRNIISEGELVDLLKINDIAPGWISNLVKMARPVPGRIDRRWAYEEGEIGEKELYDLYKDDGYDDFWAGVLSNTVIKRSVSEAKGLTRAAIVSAYKKRRLSENEAVGLLEDVGIAGAVAAFYLGQADADRADDLLDRRVDVVGRQFSLGDLSVSEASGMLGQLGVGSAEIAVYLEEWGISRSTKVRRPSRSNLDSFFKDGVIDVSNYRDQMDRLGYSGRYIDWYLAALAIERQEITEREERDARKERERVEKDRRKTDYQRDKARVDVDISELNAAIASAQVALVEAQNERDQRLARALPAEEIASFEREYQPLLFDADAAISEARLQITRLQTSIKEAREAISLVDRSLVENVDMASFVGMRAERLTSQTEQARIGELIATDRVVIAQLKAAIAAFTDTDEINAAKLHILDLQTEIAQYQEQQAFHLTRIEELDEAMAVVLSSVRRSELQAERSVFGVEIAGIEREIALLREEIRSVQIEKEDLAQELDALITALPGSEVQIAVRLQFLTLIGQIESNIKSYRENVAQLRLEKSQLAVEWRS